MWCEVPENRYITIYFSLLAARLRIEFDHSLRFTTLQNLQLLCRASPTRYSNGYLCIFPSMRHKKAVYERQPKTGQSRGRVGGRNTRTSDSKLRSSLPFHIDLCHSKRLTAANINQSLKTYGVACETFPGSYHESIPSNPPSHHLHAYSIINHLTSATSIMHKT
jgi:hypothetical protein